MKIMKVLTIGVTVGGIALAMNSEKADAAEWTPRTAEQIKAEIKGNEYTIVWGDTLSAISQATNITVQKLADMNKIANVDLIYAGNKLSFDGNVASVQNSAGETVAQTVIQDKDKVNPSQPVGQPTQEATTNNNAATDNTQTGNVEAAPSTPENNQPSTPENGGTTTPEQPSQPGGGNQGGNGGTTTPEKPETPQEPTPDYDIPGRVSPWFMTAEEAYAWAEKNLTEEEYNRARVEGTSFSDGTIRSCVVLG